ncbi:MAG: hypothetical protein ACI84K_000917 [Pseudohongiellaceae bacterium]|jgi:hypothetical protein
MLEDKISRFEALVALAKEAPIEFDSVQKAAIQTTNE